MATNCTFEWTSSGPNGVSSTQTKVISMADVTVNSAPNAVGGWTTASVTADKSRTLTMANSDGVPAGVYENVGGARFRHHRPLS